jgi:2-succinyl-6-hydroxy-2,4-cyclohexadiene-1-carboxylate synthase
VSATPGIEDATEHLTRVVSDEDHARFVEREGVEAFLKRWLAQPLFEGVPADAPGLADRWTLSVDYIAHCLRVLGTGTMQPMWSRLAELSMPVTFVTGRRDEKFTSIAARAARIRGDHVEIDSGHAIPLEAPEALASILNERLR